MNPIPTIVESIIALCFFSFACYSWFKYSRDTAIMWAAIFAVSCLSVYATALLKVVLVLTWATLTLITIVSVVDPQFYTRLVGTKDRAIAGILMVITTAGVWLVAILTKNQLVIGVALLSLVAAFAMNSSFFEKYFNSSNSDKVAITPIAVAPRPVQMRVSENLIPPPLPSTLYSQASASQANSDPVPVAVTPTGTGPGVSAG